MKKTILGQMTGTSLDGVDLSLVNIDSSGQKISIELVHYDCFEYPKSLRTKIQRAFDTNTAEICELNYSFSRWIAEQVNFFLEKYGVDSSEVEAIGFHGQTIYHLDKNSTLQIGDADVLSFQTKIPVIHDFRAADIAAGGTGAPLIPYLEKVLLSNQGKNIALQNLGGIGNVTYVPASSKNLIQAFDTGPANAILNELVELISNSTSSFDKDGSYSSKGQIIDSLLKELLSHDFLKQPPPKSTGRELFGKDYIQSLIQSHPNLDKLDVLRTLVRFVSKTVEIAYQQFLPEIDEVYISGGGLHNPVIMSDLKDIFGNKLKSMSEILNFPEDAKESIGFALLAFERLRGVPANLPEVTGAKEKVLLGKIADPRGKWPLNLTN